MASNADITIAPIAITACATQSACGTGTEHLYRAILDNTTALQPPSLIETGFPTMAGEITESLPDVSPSLKHFSSRNTRIALAAINHKEDGFRPAVSRAIEKYGAHRIGVIIGTSTSGILETENAYIQLSENKTVPSSYSFPHQHAWVATANYLQAEFGLSGPCYSVSTACSSSSKTIASAQRLIATNLCDAVITGGVDSLCRLTFHGFNSLGLMSEQASMPLDQNRSGISIGEAAGLLLVERSSEEHADCVHVLGVGESSDAHHMTAPHPEGLGASLAMQRAVSQAKLSLDDIQYVNLHATGTLKNDAAEIHAMKQLFGSSIKVSGTKGLTGHTLGAAGGLETIITWLALKKNIVPGTCNLNTPDPEFNVNIVKDTETSVSIKVAMSNNFGFGGNNTSVILGWHNG